MSFNNRPNKPVKAQFFLKMVSENAMDKNTVKKFYSTVETYAPQNVLTIYETATPDGEPTQAFLVHRELEEGGHEYEIPLVRNLTPNEIVEVMSQLESALVENDFLFETSTFDEECCLNEDNDDLFIAPDITENIAIKLSERTHTKWMNERMNKGWRYGTERSDEKKTHPLLKPWSQLAEEFRPVDYDAPQNFLDIMEEQGYTIISHEELNELIEIAEKKR